MRAVRRILRSNVCTRCRVQSQLNSWSSYTLNVCPNEVVEMCCGKRPCKTETGSPAKIRSKLESHSMIVVVSAGCKYKTPCSSEVLDTPGRTGSTRLRRRYSKMHCSNHVYSMHSAAIASRRDGANGVLYVDRRKIFVKKACSSSSSSSSVRQECAQRCHLSHRRAFCRILPP